MYLQSRADLLVQEVITETRSTSEFKSCGAMANVAVNTRTCYSTQRIRCEKRFATCLCDSYCNLVWNMTPYVNTFFIDVVWTDTASWACYCSPSVCSLFAGQWSTYSGGDSHVHSVLGASEYPRWTVHGRLVSFFCRIVLSGPPLNAVHRSIYAALTYLLGRALRMHVNSCMLSIKGCLHCMVASLHYTVHTLIQTPIKRCTESIYIYIYIYVCVCVW